MPITNSISLKVDVRICVDRSVNTVLARSWVLVAATRTFWGEDSQALKVSDRVVPTANCKSNPTPWTPPTTLDELPTLQHGPSPEIHLRRAHHKVSLSVTAQSCFQKPQHASIRNIVIEQSEPSKPAWTLRTPTVGTNHLHALIY